jgi:hypothetical protein
MHCMIFDTVGGNGAAMAVEAEEKEPEVGWTVGERAGDAVKEEMKEEVKEEVKEGVKEVEAAADSTPAATETSANTTESASNKVNPASSLAVQAVVFPARPKPTSPHVLLCSMVCRGRTFPLSICSYLIIFHSVEQQYGRVGTNYQAVYTYKPP